jgi:uncharacterized membrane protein YhhN
MDLFPINLLIIILALILLGGLLYWVKKESQKGQFITKTSLSALFIIAAIIQSHPIITFFYFLLIGLFFCMVGDICLVFPQKIMFLLGLVFFLLGHVCYTISFFNIASINQWTWIGSVVVLIISGLFFLWLKPHLGSMTLPVLLYVVVISIMVCGAWSVSGEVQLARLGRIMVMAGASSFYISDIFVARQRFIKKAYLNRFMGLKLYYLGQFLLAFSIGVLK